jgi:hypothetical protein
MTDGFRTHQTSQQPGNRTALADRLEFGKRANTGLRLAILCGLFVMLLAGYALTRSLSISLTQSITIGPVQFFAAFVLGTMALFTVFGQDTHWTCTADQIIIESASLVTAKSIAISRAEIASLKIKTSKDSDGPDSYFVELLTEAGDIYHLNQRTRDAADKALNALSAALDFTSKYPKPP